MRTDPTASPPTITAIAVIGAGTMGRGIAQVAAQAGYRVYLHDPMPAALERAHNELADVFAMLARKGRLAEAPETVLGRIRFVGDADELSGVDWVIEAAPEELTLKLELFASLSARLPDAVLATNTSTLSVTRIAAAAERPERVVGVHFFNPAPLMRLVEVIPGLQTAPAVTRQAVALAEALGKTPVVAADRPGFIVNRVARPFYGEALKLAGEGLEVAAIDRAVRGLGFRMGPFELLDLIGLDVNLAATLSVYQAFFHEPRYRPHPLQQAMVDAGRLGRKSGHGFYRYPREQAAPAPQPAADRAPLRARLLGDGPVAEALRAGPGVDEADAAIILDLRLPLAEKGDPLDLPPDLPADLPIATLTWGHSAALAAQRYRQGLDGRRAAARGVVGVGLVPPLGATPAVELFCAAPDADAPHAAADEAALTTARELFTAAGFEVVTFPDQPGGVGFRILALLVNEAASAVAEGLATPDAIDTAMTLGTNYPLGPLTWSERLGLERVLAALEGLHAELGEDRYRPQPLLRRLVAAGATTWPRR